MFAEVIDALLLQCGAVPREGDVVQELVRRIFHRELSSEIYSEPDQNPGSTATHATVPASLKRKFRVVFSSKNSEPTLKLREIRASSIGRLVNFKVRSRDFTISMTTSIATVGYLYTYK